MSSHTLSAGSPAVAHGFGLFETMLVVRGTVIHREEHCARIEASCAALGMARLDRLRLETEIERTAATGAEAPELALRCLWLAAGRDLDDPAEWILDCSIAAIPALTLQRRDEGRAITLGQHLSRGVPRHKLTSYAACTLGLRAAVAAGANEGLFGAGADAFLEGTATSLFALHDKTLVTAPLAAGVLPGVVRAWVLAQAGAIGLTIEERTPSRKELLAGSFLTGSLTTLAPLRLLDGAACAAPDAAFEELRLQYFREIAGSRSDGEPSTSEEPRS